MGFIVRTLLIFFLLISNIYADGILTDDDVECICWELAIDFESNAKYIPGGTDISRGAPGDCSWKIFAAFRRCGVPVLRTNAARMIGENASGWDGDIVPFDEGKKGSLVGMTTQKWRPRGHIGYELRNTVENNFMWFYHSRSSGSSIDFFRRNPPNYWYRTFDAVKDMRKK